VSRRPATRQAASLKRSGSVDRARDAGAGSVLPTTGGSALARTRHRDRGGPNKPSPLARVLADAGRLVKPVLEQTAFPLALLLIVGVFLGVQNRIDRGDPKLALAPVYREPDLSFGSPEDPL
jgi:hypothetical protein